MNRRTAKRWEKRARPEEIRAAFLREVKKMSKVKWARCICTVVPDGPDAVYLSATAVPFPAGYLGAKQTVHKGRKP